MKGRDFANQKFIAIDELLKAHAETLILARSAQQIVSAQSNNKIAFIVGFQNARSLVNNIDTLDDYYAKGVRVLGLIILGIIIFLILLGQIMMERLVFMNLPKSTGVCRNLGEKL